MHTLVRPKVRNIPMDNRRYGTGKHDFPETLKNCGIDPCLLHDGVRDIDEWVDRVVEFAESVAAKKYRRHTSNELKGDAFEHLVQCIIEYLSHDHEVDCSMVEVTERGKTGVDLIGRTLDGKPHLHQCKFTKDPKFNIPYRGFVAEFVGTCPRFDEGAGYGMTLWTTGNGISRNAQMAVHPSLKVFGIDWLGNTLGSDESFWDHVYAKSLGTTPKSRVGRIFDNHENTIIPHDYQQDALDTFIRKAKKEKTFKGRYIYPTGAGKTLIESLILNHQIDRHDEGVHLVIAPRIALLIQLMREYREFIGDRYVPIGLHSGNEEPESDDSDWMRRTQKNTTDPDAVKREINHAKSMRKSVVVFSTYHSLHKLTPKFGNFSFDTMIADESQYCVSENYFEQIKDIDAEIKLYFTATERHYTKKDGSKVERSNDNEKVFGECLGSETVNDLVKRGILVEPILHLMRGAPKSDEVNHDTLIAEAQHIANEQRKLVGKGLHAKTLFACREASNVEIIVDLKNNMENLKKLMLEVPDHTIFTIISKKPFGAMINGISTNRKSFLDQLKDCDGDSLIFHYNILSEGIDVDGITGVAILRKMGDAKLMQTIGRCLRPYKKDPSLKPHAYVSVPIIEDSIRKSEHLNEIVRKILESGLDIDAEKIVISDMKSNETKGKTASSARRKRREEGNEPTQIELDFIKHELKAIIIATDEKISEDYHLGMLNRKFTDDVIDEILDGKYPSRKYNIPTHSILNQLDTNLDSYLDMYFVTEKAWYRKRILESEHIRPLTPLHVIKRHVDRLGDISGKLTLTLNVEYIAYLKAKGANVVLATKEFCRATKNLAESQVIETEYLTLEAVMEKGLIFDFVIGNPPYQERKLGYKKPRSIWQDFVLVADRVLKKGGKLAMIHPPAWRNVGPTFPPEIRNVGDMLKSMDMEWLSMTSMEDCAKVFKGKTIPFDVYVARKSNTDGFSTEIEGVDGKTFHACIKEMAFIPNFQCDDVDKMIAKNGDEGLNFLFSTVKFETRKEWMSEVKTKKFCYPCVYSVSADESLRNENGGDLTFYYSSTQTPETKKVYPDHFGVPKVIFGTWQRAGIPHVDFDGAYGMCQDVGAIVEPTPPSKL